MSHLRTDGRRLGFLPALIAAVPAAASAIGTVIGANAASKQAQAEKDAAQAAADAQIRAQRMAIKAQQRQSAASAKVWTVGLIAGGAALGLYFLARAFRSGKR